MFATLCLLPFGRRQAQMLRIVAGMDQKNSFGSSVTCLRQFTEAFGGISCCVDLALRCATTGQDGPDSAENFLEVSQVQFPRSCGRRCYMQRQVPGSPGGASDSFIDWMFKCCGEVILPHFAAF